MIGARPGLVGQHPRRMMGLAAISASVAVGAGAAVALQPSVAAVAFAAAALLGAALATGTTLEHAGWLLLLFGTLVLGYGFANLGIRSGGPPIPLTELLLVPLVLVALIDRRARVPASIMTPLIGYGALVAIRLIVDYPRYEVLAIRDTTLAIEAFAFVLGYRAMVVDGLGAWVGRLRWLFGVLLLYGSIYPWRDVLAGISPTVGLQRDVPLLGSYQGLAPRLAIVLLFFAVYSNGARRVMLVGWGLALSLLRQSRGIYLILPAAVLSLGWTRRASAKVLAGGLAMLIPGVLLLSLVAGAGAEARLGEVTPDFYTGHIGTLLGGEGPSAGTLDDRVEWARQTLAYTAQSPVTVAFGSGLGPDLTFGFKQGGEILVRKPHNDFLEVYARTGLVGLGLFVWMIVAAMTPIVRRARSDTGPHGIFCSFVVGASVVMFGIALTQPLLAFPYGAVPTFFLLGLGVAAARSRPGSA